MQKTTTFLMFVGEQCGKAEEAMRFYIALFKNSEIKSIERWGKDEAGGKEGLIKKAIFAIDGQEYIVSENTMNHAFTFTPAISIFVECDTEAEITTLFQKLSNKGGVMTPLDNYGFSKKFGWTADTYGVSWQVNLAN